jgi:hypothetical protein
MRSPARIAISLQKATILARSGQLHARGGQRLQAGLGCQLLAWAVDPDELSIDLSLCD